MKYALSTQKRSPFFDDFVSRSLFGGRDHDFTDGRHLPAVNIKDEEKTFALEVIAPGRSKEDFTIELEKDILTVSSHAVGQNEESNSDENYTRREFTLSAFERSFTLPEGHVDKDSISASYVNGILSVSLPKVAEAAQKLKQSIAIS